MAYPRVVTLRMEQKTQTGKAFWRQNLLDFVICLVSWFAEEGKKWVTGDSQVSTREHGVNQKAEVWSPANQSPFLEVANDYQWSPGMHHTEKALCPDWSQLHQVQAWVPPQHNVDLVIYLMHFSIWKYNFWTFYRAVGAFGEKNIKDKCKES